ncbi:hypothetical protein, conserved [Eimeria necatrix]|uniref:Uncharacterized protein n=1 Tax=Eimeria necatrix TaxID=51315 RepID=U6MRF1_9EIME|nr:hypothetical protein, conserved [Eimeria necatrix]CDJ65668.1 hypothetical protein, conserved [Eimeria necatrix]
MTGAMLSETLYSPDNILIESALPYSGTLRSSKNNQREAKALAVRVLSSLVLLSALALLIARCALHIKNKKRSGIASRRLSDQHSHSQDSNEPSTSSSSNDSEFRLPSYEEACTQQHNIIDDNEDVGAHGEWGGDRLPSYEEACSDSPPGTSGCAVERQRLSYSVSYNISKICRVTLLFKGQEFGAVMMGLHYTVVILQEVSVLMQAGQMRVYVPFSET